ncbi:DUF6636 domain-containing protein [Mycobacteroides salmoniphilum]|uniref:DUF6636 domain-containing protein n=1 Tax=Mycobacteroides salmoniphilum TaxID=404941 RepID=UPI0010EF33D1|nr:DUF6636 domain-containing protein [Mycobacteroides salmoniphilum]TDZ97971.1 hypothetical protein CCUG62472_01000 [Mycobacteroides salmoniphilum]
MVNRRNSGSTEDRFLLLLSRTFSFIAAAATVLACFGFAAPAALADTYGVRHFTAPSGNISCVIDNEWPKPYVRCDLHEARFTPPPRPSTDCYGVWGRSVTMTIGEDPAFHCTSDSAGGENLFVLKYGDDTKVGPFQCSSRNGGITCVDTTTSRGFRLARQSYEFLP